MNPQSSNPPGLGLPSPGSETEQLPPIHAPQAFHAPDSGATHFDATTAVSPQAPGPATFTGSPAPASPPVAQPAITGQVPLPADLASQSAAATQADDTDNAFDEEWAGKARDVVGRTHADPYLQSKELGKLKAQYIKARYNKDIKVSED